MRQRWTTTRAAVQGWKEELLDDTQAGRSLLREKMEKNIRLLDRSR